MKVVIADDESIERMFIRKLLERHFPVFDQVGRRRTGLKPWI